MSLTNQSPFYSYSWHQSHDQATVLLVVPYGVQEEDVEVVIERNHLVAGIRGQPPIIKGRLYGNVDTATSTWQLEPRTARIAVRERTTSMASSASTPSSYAFISDLEISSSFAASLESAQVSDAEDLVVTSSALSSPHIVSADERAGFPPYSQHHHSRASSRAVSPGHALRSLTSSFSSLESLHSSHSGRLLTLHLEKEQSVIWPSLIVGPIVSASEESNQPDQYNMDPTSLVLIALESHDIRKDKETAFEYFVRAWHQARAPAATIRLVSHYVPVQTSFELPSPPLQPVPGTIPYYVNSLGGPRGLAQLYLEAGLLHLDGAASSILSSPSTLSSIRLPPQSITEGSTETWRRDRGTAGRYFERARALQPDLDIPVLPPESDPVRGNLEMPSLEIHPERNAPPLDPHQKGGSREDIVAPVVHRRRKKEEQTCVGEKVDDFNNTWYLYIPGLVGAGTAILVVGVVGALSFSNWRRSQGS